MLLNKMDLYYFVASPPCNAVIMAAKTLGIELNKKAMNYETKEHLKPEFTKLNPQHTLPTLVDSGFVLWESRAILTYLAEKYGSDDALYPKCAKKRAIVNQRLFFDMGTLYKSFADYYYPQFENKNAKDPEAYKKIDAAFELLNTFLQTSKFVAGDCFTVADISILASVSTFDAVGYDFGKHEHVTNWYKQVKVTTPGFDENWDSCLAIKGYFA